MEIDENRWKLTEINGIKMEMLGHIFVSDYHILS